MMSNDPPQVRRVIAEVSRPQLAAFLRTDQGQSALEQALIGMPDVYIPGKVDTEMSIRWSIQRKPADVIAMDVIVAPQRCEVQPVSDARIPTVTVTLDATSFVELASGAKRGKDLLLHGVLRLKGSVRLALKMEKLFALGD
ncbi:hypothetical protein A5782_09025 [Mycobacterium sp. 852002-40037_SCH5390672]|nr:hypothetical protein A5782_09025 [Mycobacterium sp. 852002-40037_SCH5390672]